MSPKAIAALIACATVPFGLFFYVLVPLASLSSDDPEPSLHADLAQVESLESPTATPPAPSQPTPTATAAAASSPRPEDDAALEAGMGQGAMMVAAQAEAGKNYAELLEAQSRIRADNVAAESASDAERLTYLSGGGAPASSGSTVTKSDSASVSFIVDGDTVVLDSGHKVRLIGIDTPEHGECGFAEAKGRLTQFIGGRVVTLVNPVAVSDTDRYGRQLRYLEVQGADAGLDLLGAGVAVARYDGDDGHEWHPLQSDYHARDAATGHICGSSAENPVIAPPPPPAPPPALVAIPADEPWNQPGPDLDCKDIGQRVTITGPDYHRLDADNDGIGCESY